VCNLCNRTIQIIIRNDKRKQFLFAPLQSASGQEALTHISEGSSAGSVVLLHNGTYYTRSSAALHVFRLLGGAWSLLYAFIIVPSFIRDAIYNWVARNRYKWFGRTEKCMIPAPELTSRFLS